MKRIILAAAVLFVLAGGIEAAEERLGVRIYPGAKYDEQSSKIQAQMTKATGGGSSACYRTKDPVAKVAEFYQKEGFKLPFGKVMPDSAMLQKGTTYSMTIKYMKPLDKTEDTRICIVKK